ELALLVGPVRAGVIARGGSRGRRGLRRRDVIARELEFVAAPVVQDLDRAVELNVLLLLGKGGVLIPAGSLGMSPGVRGWSAAAVFAGGRAGRSLQDAIVLEVMQQVALANFGVLIDGR